MKNFSVAIDGPAGAGKSSTAEAVAKNLNAIYLDTGAMYRAVGLYMIKQDISLDDPALIAENAPDAHVDVRYEQGVQRVYLNGEDVSDDLRDSPVSAAASAVSAVPLVRELMVKRQQAIAAGTAVVMDGRDIGTKVLPDAPLKIFLTAAPEERARRRCLELRAKGKEVDFDRLLAEIRERDYNDAHRAASPMTPADDAVILDSTSLTQDEVIEKIVAMARERMAFA